MNDRDEQERRGDQDTAADTGNEVRARMEQARDALEASGAEIERAKRLLRETESLVELPVVSWQDERSSS
jgi:hypothetical protein